MGKIRIKTFDESSDAEAAKLKAKREMKKSEKAALKMASKAQETLVMKGKKPEVVEAVEEVVTPKDSIKTPDTNVESPTNTLETTESVKEAMSPEVKEEKKKKKEKFAKTHQKTESKRHKENSTMVSPTQNYSIEQAIEALRKFKVSKFDETVELHINTKEKGVSGQVELPHGTGKTLRIKVADEAIIGEVSKGKINFDVLVAHPSLMPSLAKVAKILGPRGLMPNPKNGTISDKPEEAAKKLAGGQTNYKTESDAPIIHAIVGKVSFEDNKLKENIGIFLKTVGAENISSVTLKSTMSPAIRLQV